MSAESIFTFGIPLVRLEGEQQEYLMRVRRGEFSYEFLMEDVEQRVKHLTKIAEESSLPERVDSKNVDELIFSITKTWEQEYKNG